MNATTANFLLTSDTWVDSEPVARYVLLGSTDSLEEIDYEEAKRIATMLGFPELIYNSGSVRWDKPISFLS